MKIRKGLDLIEKGIDALSAIIQTFISLDTLRQHTTEETRIHGIITKGGSRPNIITDHASARFTVRGTSSDKRDVLVERLRGCAEGAALATGATLCFRKANQGYKDTRPNQKLAKAFTRNLVALGESVEEAKDEMGSTDVGDVSHVVPTIQARISICDDVIAGHSPEFAKAAISKRGFETMIKAAKALAMTAVDVATNEKLLREIKEEFKIAC